ncbi:uncharacterized protein LOC112453432 isoform X2 [Temnothorax curvispinosus]|uniref:Uncharacterized protein LOC112453432 isoform X2 n=1 Tax=Temnothorax curvispinosus TaxID=300111 RepID=A0A6J1PLH2_9HYME|nr:uncharacterized protein LOC112453432 isoform X2 [Temnothorax curvispinosus]
MKILVFAACILAATVGDAQLNHDITETTTSNVFDSKALIDYRLMFAACAVELGLLNVAEIPPELLYCIAQKENLIDKEGGILWDESVNYAKKLVRDENMWNETWDKLTKKCKEEYDKFEGSGYEKSLKTMECGLPFVKYIIQQKML